MSQQQNYLVSYTIDVDASKGTQQVQAFAESLKSLMIANKTDLSPMTKKMSKLMEDMEKIFPSNKSNKRQYSVSLNIKTNESERKLERIKGLLGEIKEMAKGINVVVNAGQSLNTNAVRTNTRRIINKKAEEVQLSSQRKASDQAVTNFRNAQKQITKSVGQINAALISLEKGRSINIHTDASKKRLETILSLLKKIKSGTKGIKLQISGSIQGNGKNLIVDGSIQPYRLPENIRRRFQERGRTNNQRNTTFQQEREQDRKRRDQEKARQREQREEEKHRQRDAMQAVRNTQRQLSAVHSTNNNRQRAAINRLQYSKSPSFRNMPFAYMLNGYMAYGVLRREFQDAIEYANIMQSAHSILRVADTDLGTFESRFTQMARNVRQIGVETKFTAIEVAGAVKFLSMAGMNIDTINKSIRPITNLALIGDNDISQIADLTTNIMAGYDIKNDSMTSVADIISATISRSNVNILEMAESYKMAAGYLRMSGVEFSESAAAIGILGNMGMKGTMAGTSLRAMTTRFSKPTKEAKKTLSRLGVNFTENVDVYGKQVEKLRPLADIFEDLKKKGASVEDMHSIFGKIGGNASMAFLNNYEKLRELSAQNRASFGISNELALVKQNTTKGLFSQVKSQFSESFMQGFEILEPQIRSILRNFLEKFKAPDFAKGLASIGRALLDVLSVLGNIANWVIKNFTWIEPLLFSGLVATKLFKLAGALTNVGVALGFIGKQSISSSALNGISGLLGLGNVRGISALPMASKRSLVTALNAAGITGRGRAALVSSLISTGGNVAARNALPGLFASQVASGSGLLGAGSSIAAIGTGALAATAGIAALVGAMGFLAYKTWKVKEAKDAIIEDIEANKKYRYPSIEALHNALRNAREEAERTKKSVDELTNKSVEEEGGPIGSFTGNWWQSVITQMGNNFNSRGGARTYGNEYSFNDAYQDDVVAAIQNIAQKDGQSRINAAWSDLGKLKSALEVDAFIENIRSKYGQGPNTINSKLYTYTNNKIKYNKGFEDLKASDAAATPHYASTINTQILPKIETAANAYKQAISNNENAKNLLNKAGVDFNMLTSAGYYQDSTGQWRQKPIGKNASDEERKKRKAADFRIHDALVSSVGIIRSTLGGSAEAAENVMKAAGFSKHMYSNEPMQNDPTPWNASRITNSGSGLDDGGKGGNYSGTGKLSSSAPKQVIVNISNLLSVATIDLMKSKEGQNVEIQDLKEKMAQALIDVVHDFDASWNG